MLVALWRSRFRYFKRYHSATFNRLAAWLVRVACKPRRTGLDKQLLRISATAWTPSHKSHASQEQVTEHERKSPNLPTTCPASIRRILRYILESHYLTISLPHYPMKLLAAS